MTGGFKIVAIIIIVFGGLLFARERQLLSGKKEYEQQYADEKKRNQKNAESRFTANESKIVKNETDINNCLAKVKSISLQMDETKMEVLAIKAFANRLKDSTERENGGDKAVLNKLNKKNTIIIYFDELPSQRLELVNEIKKSINSDSYYYGEMEKYTDLKFSEREEIIARAANVQYIVVAQPAAIKNGKIVESEKFETGYMIVNYEVYDIALGKQIKISSTLATNSESLMSMSNSDLRSTLYHDLLHQGKKAILKTAYGTINF